MEPLTPEQVQKVLGQAEQGQETPEPPVESAPAETPEPATQVMQSKTPESFEMTVKGVTIVATRPTVPVATHVARILGMDSANPSLEMYYTALLWIRQIGPIRIDKLLPSRDKFEEIVTYLGDDGLQELTRRVMLHGLSDDDLDLSLLKKL